MIKFASAAPIFSSFYIFLDLHIMRIWLFFMVLVFAWNPCSLFAQNVAHPSFRHYTTDDGLPSSEVYFILQDNEGFIWISTDNGVSRFDGYEFRNYGVKDGLLENVIFEMQLDSLGRVWMQAMSGNLYYLENNVIKPYWYNSSILNFKNRQDVSKGFIVEGAGEKVHVAIINYGIISVDDQGNAEIIRHPENIYHQIFEKNEKIIQGIFVKEDANIYKEYLRKLLKDKKMAPIFIKTEGKDYSIIDLFYKKLRYNNTSIFRLEIGEYFYQYSNNGWYLENGELVWHYFYPFYFTHLARMKNGEIWGGLPFNSGLRIYQSTADLSEDKGNTILPGQSVNYFMEDAQGGRWFATNENGVFYTPAETFLIHDHETGLPDENIKALAIKNENELFAGLRNGEVWHYDQRSRIWNKLPEVEGEGVIRDLYFDPVHEKLWAGRGNMVYLENKKWAPVNINKNEFLIGYANRISSSIDGNHLWLSNHFGFMSVDLTREEPAFINILRSQRTYIVQEDFSKRFWVGQSMGLFEWKDSVLLDRRDLHPAFSLRVEDIVVMSDSTLVVATKGGGVVFWKDNQFEQITMDQGLTADMMECLHADKTGVVWAGTLNGLNRISGTWNNRQVDQITVSHGLPSNEINRIRTIRDEVWVATNKGLVHFSNTTKNIFSIKPLLRNVLVNNNPIDFNEHFSCLSNENNLTIEFSAINYKMDGKIPYRYRLDNGDWVQTMSRSLNFPALPPGERFFEVQAQNEDGHWSNSTAFSFVINPPWWKTWWARSLGIGSFLMSGLIFYFFRTQQLKKAHQIQIQIAELERTALQAQMNPHFIFNCLNSIQNFILQNEQESAIMYLGSFANLVRSMLNASVLGKIPLVEEVKLLNNYLKLEKLRFKNRFDYEVVTAEGLNVFDIEIPPLLVQPYVENAVQHGIAGKDIGGKITVRFEKKIDYVEVSITDNGSGISPESKTKEHKSFGMSITQHRLELLSEKDAKDVVVTKVLKDENGQISGTQISIKIKIKEELTI